MQAERLEQQGETPYMASLEVESNELRKVEICVYFYPETFYRLKRESAVYSGRNRYLQFCEEITNVRTGLTRIENFEGHLLPWAILPRHVHLALGQEYKIQVKVQRFSHLSQGFITVLTKEVKHREVLIKSELMQLMLKAVRFTSDHCFPVWFAYRNKPRDYFNDIKINRSNIMEVYIKDNNGDPSCPINGQIQGLFFGVRPDPINGGIPDVSPFGDTRIIIPIKKLLDANTNLYFADYYCTNRRHLYYVTLVATKSNSEANKFCEKHLIRLSLYKNPFLRVQIRQNHYRFMCCTDPIVEFLYTEDVDLTRHFIQWQYPVRTLGVGSSTPGGLPKNPHCNSCNLYCSPADLLDCDLTASEVLDIITKYYDTDPVVVQRLFGCVCDKLTIQL